MELRTLRYFLAVAQEKNITRAAEILHLTQPTLSRQISDLEEELGTTLFIRGKRSLELTEDGALLRQRAQDIVELADRTEHEFAGKRDSVAGTVTIGATEALGGHDLAKAIRRFSQQYPAVRFELYNGMADLLKERIDKGALDLGLLLEPVDTTRYEFIRLTTPERWGVLVHLSHPFASRKEVAVRELIDQRLMLPSRPSARREILNWIGCEENRLNILVGYNLLSNIALLVEQGMGVAVCMDGALSLHASPDLRFVPLVPERTTRSVLVWKKNQVFNTATSLFIQSLQVLREDAAPEELYRAARPPK